MPKRNRFSFGFFPGNGLNPLTEALLAEMVVQPSTPLVALINTFFNDVDDNLGVSTFDGIWWHNLETQQQSLLNWADPAGAVATLEGGASAPTWATKVGITGTGVNNSYIDYHDPMTGGANYTQDSASFGGWDSSNNSTNTYLMGAQNSANIRLLPRSGANFCSCNINSATAGPGAINGNSEHMYAVNRSASNATQLYIDGASVASGSDVSSSLATMGNLRGLYGVAGAPVYSTRRILMAFVCRSLNPTEQGQLYSYCNAFKTGVDAL